MDLFETTLRIQITLTAQLEVFPDLAWFTKSGFHMYILCILTNIPDKNS